MIPPLEAGNALQSAAAEAMRKAAGRLAGLQAADGSWRGAITAAAPLDPNADPIRAYAVLKFGAASEAQLAPLRERILAAGGVEAEGPWVNDLPLDELKKSRGGPFQKLLGRIGGKPRAAGLEAAAYRREVLASLAKPGGTAYEPIRDTALAVRALAEGSPEHPAIPCAIQFLSRQTFELPVDVAAAVGLALRTTPAAPRAWEAPDVAGIVLEALGPGHAETRRGVDWLVEHQQFDGSWAGRWGVGYLYGTCFALRGLAAAGESDREAHVLRAGEWTRSIQNADGGWGESCRSFESGAFTAAPSTPSQTAWAILGLIAGGDPDSLSVRHGVESLVRTQRADGSWAEDQPTGVALPGALYVRRELDKDVFPLMALAAFAKARPNV